MSKTSIKSLRDGKVGQASLDTSFLATATRPAVLREAVLMFEANRRVGTADTKTRAEVAGSTKKLYKQKHTGRARHGDKKAPRWPRSPRWAPRAGPCWWRAARWTATCS